MTPAQKRRNAWIGAIIIIAPVVWTIPVFFYLKEETKTKNETCQANLRSLGAAIQSFSQAHQNQLPDARQWQNILQKQNPKTLHCPGDPVAARSSSYAMNANLSGKKLSAIKNADAVVLVYETTSTAAAPLGDGKDMADVGKPKSGQGRHNTVGYRFNYFLMADGTLREAGTPKEKKPLRWKP